MIRIFVAQLIAKGAAVIEHPARPAQRQGVQPPSIWILPIVEYLLTHSSVYMLQIQQGYWQAISPKPTNLLFVAPNVNGSTIRQWLYDHRTREDLPPPIPMRRLNTPEGGYSTAQLKRYPEALCLALASVARQLMPSIEQPHTEIDRVDPVYATATTLRTAYRSSLMNADDGADFHEFNEFNVADKLGAPPPKVMAESNNWHWVPTERKRLSWKLTAGSWKSPPKWKGKSYSKLPFGGSMLVFWGVTKMYSENTGAKGHFDLKYNQNEFEGRNS